MRALAKERLRREERRRERLAAVFRALDELSSRIAFEEAYIFGSLAKPYRYFDDSDVDIAFVGLKDEDFFQAMAFLSRELGAEVDILQLEGHPLGGEDPNGRVVTVPMHKEIGRGLLRKIIRDAELSVDEFLALL